MRDQTSGLAIIPEHHSTPAKIARLYPRPHTLKIFEISLLLVTLGIAAGILVWLNASAVNRSPAPSSISIQELHILAHLEGLPIQQIEDQSLVYPAAEQPKK